MEWGELNCNVIHHRLKEISHKAGWENSTVPYCSKCFVSIVGIKDRSNKIPVLLKRYESEQYDTEKYDN